MKKLLYLYCFLFIVFTGFCQNIKTVEQEQNKNAIDSFSIVQWPSLDKHVEITNDGSYFLYIINNIPEGSHTLVVVSTDNQWKREYKGVSSGFFSGDSKKVFFQKADTLFLTTLGTNEQNIITPIKSYRQPRNKKEEWIAYQVKNRPEDLIIYNLITGSEIKYSSVTDYRFDNNGKVLLFVNKVNRNGENGQTLKYLDLQTKQLLEIWSSGNITDQEIDFSHISYDRQVKQLAFIVKFRSEGDTDGSNGKERTKSNSIWYYKVGSYGAIELINRASDVFGPVSEINGSMRFSSNGNWLFFQGYLQSVASKPNPRAINVDVWSYKDKHIQPEQMRVLASGPKILTSVVNVLNRHVLTFQKDDEEIVGDFEDFVVLEQTFEDSDIKIAYKKSFYLVSLKDSARYLIRKGVNRLYNLWFSESGKWLAFYDRNNGSYCSYSVSEHKVFNITKSIPGGINNEYSSTVLPYVIAPIVAWLKNDSGVIVYDNYDIWLVDLANRTPPRNITNGFGRAHRLKLRLIYENIAYTTDEELLLTAFSPDTKYNGFFKTRISGLGNPKCLVMGPYTFYCKESQIPIQHHSYDLGLQPIKSKNANVWILSRQTASESPNYFMTKDFDIFTPLTELYPERKFNWLRSELVHWRQLDGTISQGILYKPENFDPRKKYPVIFNYYEQLSHRLYQFPIPEFTGDNINIPWFVSNGFLVFTPDIHYKVGKLSGKPVGEWAYNSIVSAAKYLARRSFVKANKMGLQGHSFGGLETNYLVTHTNIFTAAAEAAGSSDPISAYLTLVPGIASIEHYNKQSLIEDGHELYGATPWERPDLYRKNSAVLNADKVTTPLLIMHNMQDNNIQWRQGVELYMALRRLGKKVWMLQYDNEYHGVHGKNAVDYTIRLTQFFNYYLKDALPPKWMTQGIPASKKGIDTGYEFDTTGAIP